MLFARLRNAVVNGSRIVQCHWFCVVTSSIMVQGSEVWSAGRLEVHSEFIRMHRATSLDASLLRMLHAFRLILHSVRKSLTSSDVARWNPMNSERTISNDGLRRNTCCMHGEYLHLSLELVTLADR